MVATAARFRHHLLTPHTTPHPICQTCPLCTRILPASSLGITLVKSYRQVLKVGKQVCRCLRGAPILLLLLLSHEPMTEARVKKNLSRKQTNPRKFGMQEGQASQAQGRRQEAGEDGEECEDNRRQGGCIAFAPSTIVTCSHEVAFGLRGQNPLFFSSFHSSLPMPLRIEPNGQRR